MTEKKLALFIGIIFTFIAAVGVIFFNYLPENRVPTNGFHMMEHRGYYAFQNNENKIIDLDVFFVNNNFNGDNKLIEKFSGLCLVSNDGMDYPFALSSDEVEFFTKQINDDKYNNRIIEQVIKIDLSKMDIPNESIKFVQLKYQNEKGQIVKKNLGQVQVDFVKASDDVAALSKRVSWTRVEQPTFTEVEYLVENKSENNIEIDNLQYGSTGVNVLAPLPIVLGPLDYKEYKFDVKLTGEKPGQPIVYMLKPQFTYMKDGNEKIGVFSNISTEKYLDPDMDLLEYLYNKEKAESNLE